MKTITVMSKTPVVTLSDSGVRATSRETSMTAVSVTPIIDTRTVEDIAVAIPQTISGGILGRFLHELLSTSDYLSHERPSSSQDDANYAEWLLSLMESLNMDTPIITEAMSAGVGISRLDATTLANQLDKQLQSPVVENKTLTETTKLTLASDIADSRVFLSYLTRDINKRLSDNVVGADTIQISNLGLLGDTCATSDAAVWDTTKVLLDVVILSDSAAHVSATEYKGASAEIATFAENLQRTLSSSYVNQTSVSENVLKKLTTSATDSLTQLEVLIKSQSCVLLESSSLSEVLNIVRRSYFLEDYTDDTYNGANVVV